MQTEGRTNSKPIIFVWWYREVCVGFFSYLKRLYLYLFDLFSVRICLSTLFSPWKRDSINTEGLNINDRFQVLLLNLTSRMVGAFIKAGTILTFLVITFLTSVASVVMVFVWLLYPIIPALLVIYGVKLIIS
jgi:hypothetical protein